jgi:hypothetical protein
MKFRRKPIVVDAVQLLEDTTPEIEAFLDSGSAAGGRVGVFRHVHTDAIVELSIPTWAGVMACRRGDWLIRGVAGELYSCKGDVFDATYEPAEAS